MTDLSIIIVNYNGRNLLRKCLESIYDNKPDIDLEVFVIDNNSKDMSQGMVGEEFPRVNLIENKTNVGFTRATNQGLQRAKGKYLLCLNNDTMVLPSSLREIIRFMDNCPQAGACGGKTLNSDGTLQFSCRQFPTYFAALFNRSSLLTRLFPNNTFSKRYLMSDWPHDEVRQVDWVAGSYLIIRRKAMQEVGLMDGDYFIYCEDVDWCYRAYRAGWKVYYVPQSQIIHLDGCSPNALRKVFEHHRSMYRFYKKHYSSSRFIDCIVLAGILIRLGTILGCESLRQLIRPSKLAAINQPFPAGEKKFK